MSSKDKQDLRILSSIESIPSINNILETICIYTDMRLGVLAYVSEQAWIACAVYDNLGIGLKPGQNLQLDLTICSEVYAHHHPIIIPDASSCDNSQWKKKLSVKGFKSYISFPVFNADGSFFGTLCTIDTRPVSIVQKKITSLFNVLSESVTFHLGTLDRMTYTENLLIEERQYSRHRDTIISVLAHDLNDPLSAIISLTQFMYFKTEDTHQKNTAKVMYDAAIRMKDLINNVLDFARGKFSGGIKVDKKPHQMEPIITTVLNEAKVTQGNKTITTHFNLTPSVRCDKVRMSQVFSNLISNAIKHSRTDATIHIDAQISNGRFNFNITNESTPIPDSILRNIFKPFVRFKDRHTGGLGLGLYISKEIVSEHGGDIRVTCSDGCVTFSLWIPC